MLKKILPNMFYFSSMFPQFVAATGGAKNRLHIIHSSQAQQIVPEKNRQEFKKHSKVELIENDVKTTIMSEKQIKKSKITKDTEIEFSGKIQQQEDFLGIATKILASAFVFSRKQKNPDQVKIEYKNFKEQNYVLELVAANLRAKQIANMRGDQANPEFFLKKAKEVAETYNLKLTYIKGNDLIKQGFRLMHAVGRASSNEPIFINLAYNGDPQSSQWTSFVGKGVCFDSGGLNLKSTAGIKEMHMDKHGAASVLSALQSITKLKLKVNLTVSMGFVENFVSANSYRPLDIIKSRKGLQVQIGNTDAEGRLVLADCMNWTQQNFKVKNMIQLSTLTGAIVIALGNKHAGLFSNSDSLATKFMEAGRQVDENSWRMPVDEYHHELIKAKHADITNSSGKTEASSSQAAAFLQRFVEKDVNWIHLDIAGSSNKNSEATGYGSKALINYIKNSV